MQNHFSSLLGSPKIPFCRVQFLSSRSSRMRLIFCSHSANFPKSHAAIVQASAAHHCELPGLGTVFLLSFVRRRTIFWNVEFWSKTPKRFFFGPLLLRHWCTNPCCSITAEFVFLVRVARYANNFSSLLGFPKIPFCRVQFLSSRTSRMRLFFAPTQPTSRKENPCCYRTGQCCSSLRTARARSRFPALVRP